MRKISQISFLLLGSCAVENTPDFILKYTDPVAYEVRQLEQECYNDYSENRVIQIDGVDGAYYYMSNSGQSRQACGRLNESVLETYQAPQVFAGHRGDIKPLTK